MRLELRERVPAQPPEIGRPRQQRRRDQAIVLHSTKRKLRLERVEQPASQRGRAVAYQTGCHHGLFLETKQRPRVGLKMPKGRFDRGGCFAVAFLSVSEGG